MTLTIEPIKPRIGSIVRLDKARLTDPAAAAQIRAALEQRHVLVFPEIHLTDAEQLAFTDAIGERTNFTGRIPGSNVSSQDVLKLTLDKAYNHEPDYVLVTFFWHVDGMLLDIPIPKATMLSARSLPAAGGQTQFANLYAAYADLPEAEKARFADIRVIHTLEAAMRPVFGLPSQERLDKWRSMSPGMEHPLVWTHEDGRKSLLVCTHADGIVGMPGPHARALLCRLQEWASQPDYVYTHDWKVGDLLIWNNEGVMHRVMPYTDERRAMHRTSIAGRERPGRVASPQEIQRLLEAVD